MLQALLLHGPCIVVTIDAQSRVLTINRTAPGREAAALIGTSIFDHLPPSDCAAARAAIAAVLRTGVPGQFEAGGTVASGPSGRWVTEVLPVQPRNGVARAVLLSIEVTATRRAEQALRASEARFRALVEASADVVYRMGPDWTEMRHLEGQDFIADRHAPTHRWLEDYIPPEDRPEVLAAIDAAIRGRRLFELEHRVLRVDGSVGWTRSRAVPLFDDSGAIVEWVGTATDVTEQRARQQALVENEERLRYALEASGEGLWDRRLDNDLTYFSPAFTAMLGLPPLDGDQPLAAMAQRVHPDDLAVVARAEALLDDPGQFVVHLRMRHVDGSERWIESRGKTVRRDAQGRPLRAIGTHVDITEWLQLKQALQRNEAMLRAIVEGTTDAVFVKDLQGRYLLVNQALCTMVGRTESELLGRDAAAFLPPDATAAMRAIDAELIQGGVVRTDREALAWTEGDVRHFLTTKGPLRSAQGEVVGIFGVARDLTELLRQESAQRQALEESRNLLDMALAGAELGTWDIDLRSGEARYDERYLAIQGQVPGELAPTREAWLQRVHPDDRPRVDAAIAAHERGDTRLYETEHRVRHKEGHWVWVQARGKVQRDADGRPVRAVGTHQDITDRKRVATEGAALLKQIEALIAGLGSSAGRAPPPEARPASSGFQVRLTPRSREVLALLAAGLTSGEIAQRLSISKDTASTHRRNLLQKLGLRNKAELIRYAIEHGIAVPARR